MATSTKICATIGPSCSEEKILASLLAAGLGLARLNFSHGTHPIHQATISTLRRLARDRGVAIPIMQDLTGPRIRTGALPPAGFAVRARQTIVFNTAVAEFKNQEIPLNYPDLSDYVRVGERILIDDGRVEARLTSLEAGRLIAEVIEGSVIGPNKGINFPDSVLDIPVLRPKDQSDLEFGLSQGVDMVAMSFVKNAHDLVDTRLYLRQLLQATGAERAPLLIAKIEHQEAVRNIAEIVEAADGIMVARGDLGLEIPYSEVPFVQKQLIAAAHAAGKPAMVATQLLDSMRFSRRPTRAEVCDVANAVLDGADALILTNETAVGEHPVAAVETLANIIATTEIYQRRRVLERASASVWQVSA